MILITNRDYFEDSNIPEYDAMPTGKPPSDISLTVTVSSRKVTVHLTLS